MSAEYQKVLRCLRRYGVPRSDTSTAVAAHAAPRSIRYTIERRIEKLMCRYYYWNDKFHVKFTSVVRCKNYGVRVVPHFRSIQRVCYAFERTSMIDDTARKRRTDNVFKPYLFVINSIAKTRRGHDSIISHEYSDDLTCLFTLLEKNTNSKFRQTNSLTRPVNFGNDNFCYTWTHTQLTDNVRT